MNKTLKEILTTRYELISSLIAQLENKMALLPDGRITVRQIQNNSYYYLKADGSENILALKDAQPLIEDIIQKQYYEKVLKVSKQESKALRNVLAHYPEKTAEDIYSALSEERQKFVKPIIPTTEQFVKEWQEKPYTPKEFKEGTPVYETLRKERVRSKSEQIIADRLYVNGIPYKYECPLKVNNKVIHPDFTILRKSDRKELYHEHLGKTDDEKYQNDNVPRLNDYILAGHLLGDTLFLSFESLTTPLDVRVIDRMIKEHYR